MTDFRITRVVLACDPVGESRSSIDAAARLAAWLNTALHAVFIEDEQLLNLAAMPFARHIGAGGDTFDAPDEAALLHQFAAHAERLRSRLAAAAQSYAIGWSFAVVRGMPSIAILETDVRDLLVVEATTRPFAGSFRLASRWLDIALDADRPMLLLRDHEDASHELVALIQQRGSSAERVMAAAAALAQASDRPLTVLVADQEVTAEQVLQAIAAVSDRLAARSRIEWISLESPVLDYAAAEGRLLILDGAPEVNDRTALRAIMVRTQADILFLR